MTFLAPQWLLLAIPLGLGLWFWRPGSSLASLLRVGVLACVLGAMAGAAMVLPRQEAVVIVLADRSDSMPQDHLRQHEDFITSLLDGKPAQSELGVISFGRGAMTDLGPQQGGFPGFLADVPTDQSDLATGIEHALSLLPPERPARLVVLSDGRWTGRNPQRAALAAAARGVPLDYRLIQRNALRDVAVARLDLPLRAAPGEGYLISAEVFSSSAETITYRLRRGGQLLEEGTRALAPGTRRLTFKDRADAAGTLPYSLELLTDTPDDLPENNLARALLQVEGPKPALVVTNRPEGFPQLLNASGLDAIAVSPEEASLDLATLSSYSGLILENVQAPKLGRAGMETAAQWVTELGHGLMMTGGKSSYGIGGYYRSPLEPILPVSMELRKEHRRLSIAIAIVLDRSGSMSAPVSASKTKMDLANVASAEVFNLLGPNDEIAVIAVDSSPHIVAPLTQIAGNDYLRDDILSIESMGGGIFVYQGLFAAAQMMAEAKSLNRHIILFADAADAEEPGQYKELLEKLGEEEITVSTVGLGTEDDADAELLKEIAELGNGRSFFTEDAEELPMLFTQDTFVVARNAFLEEEVTVQTAGPALSLFGQPMEFGAPIGGYNLCYLTPEGDLAAFAQDEYEGPIIASRQAGLGRVLCYTGEVNGAFTGPIAQDSGYPDMLLSMARWTVGQQRPLPMEMLATQEVERGVLRMTLHLDPERAEEPFRSQPYAVVLHGTGEDAPARTRSPMRWTSPDTLVAEHVLTGEEVALGAVTAPGVGLASLSPVRLPYSSEFAPTQPGEGRRALGGLARATGGVERLQAASVWEDIPETPQRYPLAPWLASLAAFLFLLEIFLRRAGSILPTMRLVRTEGITLGKERKPKEPKRQKPATVGKPKAPTSGGFGDALKKARSAAKDRLRNDEG